MVEWWLSKNVENRKYSTFCWTNCFASHVYMSQICMSAVNIKQSHMDGHPRSKHNIIQEQTHLEKVKTVHGQKVFPHVDNPEKGFCVLCNLVEKAAQYIWLLPWTTRTHTDVIFPASPSPSLFLSFSLPNALSLDWIAPWSQAPVAMWRPLPPPPLEEWKWPDWCPATLYQRTAPLSSWWLQSCHTAWSIRGSPAVLTDHCLSNNNALTPLPLPQSSGFQITQH